MTETIIAIINTLNDIEVHGEKNLDKLLGCIQVLKELLTQGGEQDG